MADALSTMGPQIDADKKALLAAAATGGSAGIAAYKAGQDALGAERQASVARAAQRASLIGGPESQGFEAIPDQYYGRGLANLASSRATFEGDMSRRLAANQDYLSKAAASIPAYRAETDRLVGLKAAAAKDKAAKEAADKFSVDALLGLASSRAAQPATPLTRGATTEERNQIATDEINRQLAGQGDTGKLTDLAYQIGSTLGVKPSTLAELYSPAKQSSLANATANLAPKDTVAKAIATKYDTRGVTYDSAKSALSSPDFKAATADLMTKAQSGGFTRSQVDQHLRDQFLRDNPALYWILAGEYLSLFPEE